MTQKFAEGDRDGALNALQSVWVLITAVLTGVLLIALALFAAHDVVFSGLRRHAHFEDIAKSALALVVYAIAAVDERHQHRLSVLASLGALGTISTRFRRSARRPRPPPSSPPPAALGGGVVGAALSMTAVRIAGAVIYYACLRRFEPWVRLGWSHASIAEIRRLSRPALASLSMTLSTALSLQGTVLALGLTATPAAAAVFATARLLTRTPLQFIGLVNRATLPEMTAAYARRDVALSARLILLNLAATALVAAPSALVFTCAGPWLLEHLSKGRLSASTMLFAWLAAVATLQGAWNTVGQFLYSMNRQQTFSHYYLLVGGLVAAAFVPGRARRSGRARRHGLVLCRGADAGDRLARVGARNHRRRGGAQGDDVRKPETPSPHGCGSAWLTLGWPCATGRTPPTRARRRASWSP